MIKIFTTILILISLTGCGIINGESDYIPYTEALKLHSTVEADRISDQAKAISNAAVNAQASTPTEKILLAVIAMMEIERLQPTKLNVIKPTTGFDVLNRHVGTMVSSALTGALGYFAYDAIKEVTRTGGNTFNGDVNADTSFNTSEFHQTYSSGAVGSLSPYVVEPVETAE